MIIRDIIIDGFGIFNSFEIKNLRSGINIISGHNEAGKSTLLKFIKYTLFGYPRFKEQRMVPLRGGNHGGRIKLLISSGEEILIDRAGTDQLTFYYNGTTSYDKNQWSDILGNANDSIFRNIYAFSIDELAGLDSFSDSGLEDRLFSLGSGLGNISIGGISGNLQQTIDSIYSTRGKNQKIPAILKKIEEKKRELEPVENNITRYRELQEKIISLRGEAAVLESETTAASHERNRLENYLKCYSSYTEISGIDEELAKLPDLNNYPENGVENLSELERIEENLKVKIRDLVDGNYDQKSINDLENETSALTFRDVLLARKIDVDFLRNNLELYIQTLTDKRNLSGKLVNVNSSIYASMKSINSEWTEENIAELNELVVHQDRIRSFKSDFDVLSRKKLEAETLLKASSSARRVVNTRNLLRILSVLVLSGSLPFFIYDLTVAGIVLVASSIVIFLSERFILIKDPDLVDKKKVNDLNDGENKLWKDYENYISKSLHLHERLTPESVLEIILIVADLKKNIAEKDSVKRSLTEKDLFITSFESHVQKFDDIIIFNSPDTIDRVRQILNEYSRDAEISFNKASLQNEIEKRKRNLERANDELKTISGQIETKIKSIGAKDREDYISKYAQNNRVIDLKAARKKEIITIGKIAGLEKVSEVIEFLKTNSQVSIKQNLNLFGEELKKKTDALGQLREETGRIMQEVRQIENNSDMAEILTGIETEKEKLDIEYQNWLANKLALRVLTEVRGKFEKEKQPEVIRNSSLHFRNITGGKFTRISSSMDNREITVFDINENAKRIDQLSRGTREQLLLSLRLGIIEEYERHSEPLPLVVDEIFVNFDPERTVKTAEIFADFARNRQVIIFTCHPDTAGYFKRSGINLINLS